ncbi:MAG: hypothetical protein ACK4L7_06825 [Flavobacteriales bacterium]
MQYRALNVLLGPQKHHVGLLFQYGTGPNAITRLVPEPAFWGDDKAPVLSQNALVEDPQARMAFLAEYTAQPFFNGEGDKLPTFFLNLLPEGPLRRHLEEIGNLEAPEAEGLEESPVKQFKRAKRVAAEAISPDDPLIGGCKPGKQIELGLED